MIGIRGRSNADKPGLFLFSKGIGTFAGLGGQDEPLFLSVACENDGNGSSLSGSDGFGNFIPCGDGLAVNGKNAKLLVCQDRACGYRETVSRTTNARCPICHKRMEMIGKGDDGMFVCSCGHKERLSKFQERRKKEGGGVSKRDVHAYMKKQQKEAKEPVNSAFADALKNIRLN